MKIKEYNVFKTVNKTAKENNLIIAETNNATVKRLFDFSLLEKCNLQKKEIETIKKNAINYVFASSKISYYGKKFDEFDACDGIAEYYLHRVFSKTGKHLYDIFQLTEIKHKTLTSNSIYDKFYNTIEHNFNDGYDRPLTDYEI